MRVRIGDIVEIRTAKGLAYALYTHRYAEPPKYGALLRVFDRLYPSRPGNIAEIILNPVKFSTFFPLGAAVSRGIVAIAGNVPVPDHLSVFPIFRAAGFINPKTKRVENWWLWDGNKSWPVGDLKPEQRQLPIRAVWNHTMLVQRIESGWSPEKDLR